MKTILLMSCALCAGSQGWAMDIENSLTDAPGKPFAMLKDVEREDQTAIKSRTDSSYSDKDSLEEIKEANRSESEGPASEEDTMRKLDRKLYQAFEYMAYNVSEELWSHLDRFLEPDALGLFLREQVQKFEGEIRKITESCTRKAKERAKI